MSRELKTVVLVDGEVYGPGYITDVPDHVAQRITNPAAWGEDVESDEGHGIPGDHEQLASGLLPHTPVQPNQITMAEPAGPGGLNPLLPASEDTGSSAVPAGANTPAGVPSATAPLTLTEQQQDTEEQTEPVPAETAAEPEAVEASEPTETVETVEEEVIVEEQTEEVTPAGDGQALPEPPRSGKGSGIAAWRAYAEQFDVDVAEDATRDDIIAQLKDAGHIQ